MHILKLPADVQLGPDHTITAGEYVLDDLNAAHLLMLCGAGEMQPCTYIDTSDGEPRYLFMRAGGFGDLLLLTPVLRELKRRHPGAEITVCTMQHYAPALVNLPYIEAVAQYPMARSQVEKFNRFVWLENAIERNPEARTMHMTDLYAKLCAVDSIEDKRPDYRVKPTEAIWANEAYPRHNGTRRVCIQVKSSPSGRCRNYPTNLLGEAIGQLTCSGWEVLLMGLPGDVNLQGKTSRGLRDLTNSSLTFRQSCAVINTADAFIGPDSALLHVAGALAVPAVGLYGAFPWKLRTAYCPTTFSLQGDQLNENCSPCHHHTSAARQDHFPANCPTRERGYCGVIANIKPDRIVAKVEQIARKDWQPAQLA